MADTKGTTLVFLKQAIARKGGDLERRFLNGLSPDEVKLYTTVMPVSWLPIEPVTRMLKAGAETLYPGDRQGLRKIGHDLAQDNLTGLYKVLIKMTTVPFLMAQIAKLWETYHKQGRARIERTGEGNQATMIVEDYPDLPADFRELLCGYVVGAMELTGARNVRIEHDARDPKAWRWAGSWE